MKTDCLQTTRSLYTEVRKLLGAARGDALRRAVKSKVFSVVEQCSGCFQLRPFSVPLRGFGIFTATRISSVEQQSRGS